MKGMETRTDHRTTSIEVGEGDRALIEAAVRRIDAAHRALGEEVIRHRRAVAEHEACVKRSRDQLAAIGQSLLAKYIPDGDPRDWTLIAEEARFVHDAHEGDHES